MEDNKEFLIGYSHTFGGFFGFVRGGGYLAEAVQESSCHRAPGNN